jgi:hypothetical protein
MPPAWMCVFTLSPLPLAESRTSVSLWFDGKPPALTWDFIFIGHAPLNVGIGAEL